MVRGSKTVRPPPSAPLSFLTRAWGTKLALDCIEEEFGATVKVCSSFEHLEMRAFYIELNPSGRL